LFWHSRFPPIGSRSAVCRGPVPPSLTFLSVSFFFSPFSSVFRPRVLTGFILRVGFLFFLRNSFMRPFTYVRRDPSSPPSRGALPLSFLSVLLGLSLKVGLHWPTKISLVAVVAKLPLFPFFRCFQLGSSPSEGWDRLRDKNEGGGSSSFAYSLRLGTLRAGEPKFHVPTPPFPSDPSGRCILSWRGFVRFCEPERKPAVLPPAPPLDHPYFFPSFPNIRRFPKAQTC